MKEQGKNTFLCISYPFIRRVEDGLFIVNGVMVRNLNIAATRNWGVVLFFRFDKGWSSVSYAEGDKKGSTFP